jgi:hypothetical protein
VRFLHPLGLVFVEPSREAMERRLVVVDDPRVRAIRFSFLQLVGTHRLQSGSVPFVVEIERARHLRRSHLNDVSLWSPGASRMACLDEEDNQAQRQSLPSCAATIHGGRIEADELDGKGVLGQQGQGGGACCFCVSMPP